MKLIILIIVSSLLTACTGKPPKERNLVITQAAITSNNCTGGALVKYSSGGVSSLAELTTPPFVISIPDGQWNIEIICYLGGYGTWSGPYPFNTDIPTTANWQCGSANVTLGAADSSLDITVSTSNCGNAPYPSIMAGSVASKWDTAKWDAAIWSP